MQSAAAIQPFVNLVAVAPLVRAPVPFSEPDQAVSSLPPVEPSPTAAKLTPLNPNLPLAPSLSPEADTETNDDAAPVGDSSVALEPDTAPDSATAEPTNPGLLTEQERAIVRELAARDLEVRSHEQAHANVGGRFAGAPQFTFETGPNGVRYAVAGEVPIDVSPVPNDPAATIAKMEIVRRAALAPAQPSAQDLAVAAEATRQLLQARAELAAQRADAISGFDASTRPELGSLIDVAV